MHLIRPRNFISAVEREIEKTADAIFFGFGGGGNKLYYG